MSDWILVLIKKLLAENFKAARVDPYNWAVYFDLSLLDIFLFVC